MVSAFDRFVEVRTMRDDAVAMLMREMEIDIAVDLSGYTDERRTRVLAYRPAPIQVNYLGYPGTTGADYLDYIVADRFVIPETNRAHYAEKVVYLPDSYQANTERLVAERSGTRVEAGLPARGFVFCCFNNTYKVRPQLFDLWMRLLHQIDKSVLWLLEENSRATATLRREAEARQVSPDRLLFSPRANATPSISRANVTPIFFSNTLPYNAHTTGSDALWMGLPVLTCLGTTFPGRVAASLVHAIGMPELVTDLLEAYEAQALALARYPEKLAAIKAKLAAHRGHVPAVRHRPFHAQFGDGVRRDVAAISKRRATGELCRTRRRQEQFSRLTVLK